MITDIIVILSLALTAAFVVGWFVSPSLRAWIERPKHHFQQALRQYDESCGVDAGGRTR